MKWIVSPNDFSHLDLACIIECTKGCWIITRCNCNCCDFIGPMCESFLPR